MELMRPSPWPPSFARIPDEAWAKGPVDGFATGYDSLQRHGWYDNLRPTVKDLAARLKDGGIAVDYSGGTGILEQWLLAEHPDLPAGIVNVDASAKFLRLAVERLGHDPRCAFRFLAFRKDQGRLSRLEEAVPELAGGHTDLVVCANAIHLYPDPAEVMRSWANVLRPGGHLHVQSGNVVRPGSQARIIDSTVEAAEKAARGIARREARLAPYRAVLDDPARMAAYDGFRRRYFPAPRTLGEYRAWLEAAGFSVGAVRHEAIEVRLDEWTSFLSVYHDGILPWVGGVEKVDGKAPSPQAVEDRLRLLADALKESIGAPTFEAEWTYIEAARR